MYLCTGERGTPPPLLAAPPILVYRELVEYALPYALETRYTTQKSIVVVPTPVPKAFPPHGLGAISILSPYFVCEPAIFASLFDLPLKKKCGGGGGGTTISK